ncbi:GerAB/ArcD/ProY family transporter [Paenibacillus azoreducens]|uniref:Germination protein n=1 Tax=Paenibacillus azoreducens TaxID=116718 RepID=A0A919YB83_9BACL|nr:endospore germination permease [Paenibacillus azoreducens]GIO45352.1 germination protein [Paenibacillus azoreducens]
MLEKGRLATRQLVVLVFLCTVGDMFQLYPSDVASISRQDAWISALLTIVGGVVIIIILLIIARIQSDKSWIESCIKVLGKWPGTVISIWYLLYFWMVCAYLVREIGDFMTTEIFMTTPLLVVHFLIILLILWAVKAGLESIGRSSEIMLPMFLLAVFTLVVSLFPQIDLHHLKPIGEQGPKTIVRGTIVGTAFPFGELSVLLMLTPYVNKQPHWAKEVLLIVIAAGTLLSLTTAMSLLVLGIDLTAYSVYPMYVLAQKINIGNFFQRIEAIMAIAYLITTFFKAVVFFYAFTLGTGQLFRLKCKRILYLPGGMLVFAMAILFSGDAVYYLKTLVMPWMFWDLTNGAVVPLIFGAVYWIRKKWFKSDALK